MKRRSERSHIRLQPVTRKDFKGTDSEDIVNTLKGKKKTFTWKQGQEKEGCYYYPCEVTRPKTVVKKEKIRNYFNIQKNFELTNETSWKLKVSKQIPGVT